MRKINDFKNDVWKVERVRNFFENLNSFLDDVENDTNILKKHFLYFCWFFLFLDFQGRPPTHSRLPWSIFMGDLPTHTQSGLFSGATSPHTHAYPGLFSWETCPHILKVVYFHGRPAHTLTLVYFQGRSTHTLTLVYFHGRPAHTLTLVYFHGRPAHTHSH